MLSPLKPLLCRHDFYWSERHRSDRCRRCGKTRAADAAEATIAFEPRDSSPRFGEASLASSGGTRPLLEDFLDLAPLDRMPSSSAARHAPGAKGLTVEARKRRDGLLTLLDRIAEGGQPSRQDSLDALLGVIEDAHSADPVLFGTEAVERFARLHEARRRLLF